MSKLLVVVDMQTDFINGSLGSKAAESIVPKVVEKIQSWNGEIWLTRDTHDEGYLQTNEGKHLPVEHCIRYSNGYWIPMEILRAIPDGIAQIIDKRTFGSLPMAELARESGFDSIEIIGLCTDICVIANAILLKTLCPEIELAVDAACCAGTSLKNHLAALRVMQSCHIDVKNMPKIGGMQNKKDTDVI